MNLRCTCLAAVAVLALAEPVAGDTLRSVDMDMSFAMCKDLILTDAVKLGTAPLIIKDTAQLKIVWFQLGDGVLVVRCLKPEKKRTLISIKPD